MGKVEHSFKFEGSPRVIFMDKTQHNNTSADETPNDLQVHLKDALLASPPHSSAATSPSPLTNGSSAVMPQDSLVLSPIASAPSLIPGMVPELSSMDLRSMLGDEMFASMGLGPADMGGPLIPDFAVNSRLNVDFPMYPPSTTKSLLHEPDLPIAALSGGHCSSSSRPTDLNFNNHHNPELQLPWSSRTRRKSTGEEDLSPNSSARRKRQNSAGDQHNDAHLQPPPAPLLDSLIDLAVVGGHTPLHEEALMSAFVTTPSSSSLPLPKLTLPSASELRRPEPATPPVLPDVVVATASTEVELSGKKLQTVTLSGGLTNGGPSLSTPGRVHATALHVSTTDIFQAYFADKHWDEFKLALEESKIVSQPAQSFSVIAGSSSERTIRNSGEIIDVVTLEQVKLLLTRMALKKAEQDALPPPVEETPGVRTRQNDLGGVPIHEIAGKRLPYVTIREKRYVRLVDVEKRLMQQNGQTAVTNSQLMSLRKACLALGVTLGKIRNNDKSRLIVYGNSMRHNSLTAVRTEDLPRLVGYEQKRRKANVRAGKPAVSDCSDYFSSGDEEGPKSPPPSPLSRTSAAASQSRPRSEASDRSSESTRARQNRKRKGAASRHQEGTPLRKTLRTVAPQMPSVNTSSSSRPQPPPRQASEREDLNLSEPGSSDSEDDEERKAVQKRPPSPRLEDLGVCMYVPADDDVYLAAEEVVGVSDDLDLKPCTVAMERSHGLPVMVSNTRMERGPLGRYYNHLYRFADVPCIVCCQCKQLFTVSDFLSHTHSGTKMSVADARLYMHVDNPGAARFDLWHRLNEKLTLHGLSNCAARVPADLASHYESKVAAARFARREERVAAARARAEPDPSDLSPADPPNDPQPRSQTPQMQPSSLDRPPSSHQMSSSTTTTSTTNIPALPGWRRKPGGNAAEAVLTRLSSRSVRGRLRHVARRVPVGLRDPEKEALCADWYQS